MVGELFIKKIAPQAILGLYPANTFHISPNNDHYTHQLVFLSIYNRLRILFQVGL